INAGERGLIFKYDTTFMNTDVLMAFYALADYERGSSPYSDQNDLVDITNYDMNIDLREPKKTLGLKTRIQMISKVPDLKAVTFTVGESLSERDNERLRKQMRLKSVQVGSTTPEFVQEDWESGFTVFLSKSVKSQQPFEIEVNLEGDFL